MQKKGLPGIAYMAVAFGICMLPAFGMVMGYSGGNTASEKRALAKFPELWLEDGTLNQKWLSLAGDYFQEHFAFRSEMVTGNAKIRSLLFGVSADDGVIVGTEGWLYYRDSLEDYLGCDLLGERGIYNIAHSMALLQEYLQSLGVDFLYVPVPNKNSVYGEYMPYYYQYKVSENKNLENLYQMLDAEKVNYVNLYQQFSESEEMLYHKKDSHWTNRGAAAVGETILESLGREFYSYETEHYETRTDFSGDLNAMLFPAVLEPEEEVYYEREHIFSYDGEIKDNFDPKINTVNDYAEDSLIMYRDSFGNALLPFIADSFGKAYFSRSVPYPIMRDLQIYDPDTMIVERAERLLRDTAKNPPVMMGLLRKPTMERILPLGESEIQIGEEKSEKIGEKEIWMILKEEGNYLRLDGILDDTMLESDSPILIQIDSGNYYEAFPVTIMKNGLENEYGFRLYFPKEVDKEKESYDIRILKIAYEEEQY